MPKEITQDGRKPAEIGELQALNQLARGARTVFYPRNPVEALMTEGAIARMRLRTWPAPDHAEAEENAPNTEPQVEVTKDK